MPDNRSAAPSPLLMALEVRALVERVALLVAAPVLRRIGRGDEHPVLVLPGFTADDLSTAPLRSLLRSQGYWTYGWRLGRNLGPTPQIVDGLVERFESIRDRHAQPVSLVGWSLGGIFARELARRYPADVRLVITLGSPFRMRENDRSAASGMWQSLRHLHAVDLADREIEADRPSLTMPSTSIYTRTDGIVRWWQCLEDAGPQRENVEVIGSHSGLGFNPTAVIVVSDRLAQPAGEWHPFRPPGLLRHLYPRPSVWDEALTRQPA